MRFYAISPTNWTAELVGIMRDAGSNDIIIVDSESRREFAENVAPGMLFRGRIEVE